MSTAREGSALLLILYELKLYTIMEQKFWDWMSKENKLFSTITGEEFTNAEVVITHIGLVAFLLLAISAGV